MFHFGQWEGLGRDFEAARYSRLHQFANRSHKAVHGDAANPAAHGCQDLHRFWLISRQVSGLSALSAVGRCRRQKEQDKFANDELRALALRDKTAGQTSGSRRETLPRRQSSRRAFSGPRTGNDRTCRLLQTRRATRAT